MNNSKLYYRRYLFLTTAAILNAGLLIGYLNKIYGLVCLNSFISGFVFLYSLKVFRFFLSKRNKSAHPNIERKMLFSVYGVGHFLSFGNVLYGYSNGFAFSILAGIALIVSTTLEFISQNSTEYKN